MTDDAHAELRSMVEDGHVVMPAKAESAFQQTNVWSSSVFKSLWIPAFAGMTSKNYVIGTPAAFHAFESK